VGFPEGEPLLMIHDAVRVQIRDRKNFSSAWGGTDPETIVKYMNVSQPVKRNAKTRRVEKDLVVSRRRPDRVCKTKSDVPPFEDPACGEAA
jgi:hypothetical protein